MKKNIAYQNPQKLAHWTKKIRGIAAQWRIKNPVAFWIVACLSGCVIIGASFYLYIAYLLPLPDVFRTYENIPTSKIYDRNGVLLYEVLRPELGKNSYIPLEKIPETFINATLSAEDINYYSHPGVDFGAIIRALLLNIEQQRVVSGGSTITQQLVRNMLNLNKTRTYSDKIMEAIYSVRLSHAYSKDKILELYLNRIYYGNLSYGAQTASLNYFAKNIYDLDLAQISFLAGLPQSPSGYNPYTNFELAKKRQKYVLTQMVKYGFISQSSADAAGAEQLRLRSNKTNMKAPHFVQYVMTQIEEIRGEDFLIDGGVSVTTTLDYNLQLLAEKSVNNQIQFLARNNVNNGALISLDTATGQILAYVGSADYFNEEIAGAVDMVRAERQPGSSIKPLTYLAAFEKGYTPATVIYDIPTQFDTATGPYAPKNYDLDYHGPVRARIALASSYNIPAVKTLEYVGVENFIGFLRKMGVDTLKNSADYYGLALTLGGGEVRMIDMAGAFNVIANYGVTGDTASILEIRRGGKNGAESAERASANEKGKNGTGDGENAAGNGENAAADGEKVFEWKQPKGEYVLGPLGREHAYQIIDILKDPSARMPGFGEDSVLQISHEAAVKTGTTRNFNDNWTIGFTPRLLTAVWVGNADSSPMENVSGVDGAAPIWANFMEGALAGKPKELFSRPDSLNDIEVCAISGMKATALCPDKIVELFAPGSEPTKPDDYYREYSIDKATGYAIPSACTGQIHTENITKQILLVYPSALQKWAVGKGYKPPVFLSCQNAQTGSSGYSSDYPSGYSPDYPQSAITIDNPLNEDVYMIDSTIPINSQKIPLRVTTNGQINKVRFIIDDKPVGESKIFPYTYMWIPALGQHKLRAIAVNQNGDEIEKSIIFTVK